MNLRFASLLILIILLTGSLKVSAQETGVFSGEPSQYPDELSAFMLKNPDPKSSEALNKFIVAWTQDSMFSEPEKRQIILLSGSLVEKNARPYPQFYHYLNCMLSFKKNPRVIHKYSDWEKGLGMLLSEKKTSITKVDRYLTFMTQLADSNILFHSNTVEWRHTASDFRIVCDTTIRIIISNTNLICYVRKDSITITGTSGEYYPLTTYWKGHDGLVTWERAGFKKTDVFANLSNYEINMSRAEYTAKDAVFVNKMYFDSPLKGILTDRVKMNKTPDDADYPQFNSYQKDFKIKELYKEIDYEGGLMMQGARLVGSGSHDKQAHIFIYHNDTLVLIARSGYFSFKSSRINASNAAIIIKLKNDSIFHPGLALSFIVPSRELTLFQTDNFMSKSPYFNSYHNIDMYFEQLVWKMDQPVMRFTATMGSTISNADFESINFFNINQFERMQLMDEVHPLVSIRSFSRYMNSEQFLAEDFADYLKKSVSQVKQLLMRMAARGFIFYDSETGIAKIRPRLNDYIAASVAKVDYDVISFPSRTNSPVENAVFDLRNYDLTINGIPSIAVSDSQNVVIYPDHDRIIMKKNRHFQFDGQIQAGLFTFSGKNFFFNYDTFKIDLQKIDSLRIRYLTDAVDNYGFHVVEKSQSLLENMKGELLIDRPDNKSGRKSYPEYPIFISRESGYVYYDNKKIHDGIYKRDNFFFKIKPFRMDNLDNFNRRSLQFEGTLTSAGIFPDINETLRLQPDKSLGFKKNVPEPGSPVYNGKGTFSNDIQLSNHGLTGSGTINYLTSATLSDEIEFFPDSLHAVSRDFTIAQKTSETQFPQVSSVHNQVDWLPYKDEMDITRIDSNFTMFNPSTTLAGNLELRPSGLTGNGKMFLEGADLTSNHYAYRANEIDADTSSFYLKSIHATSGYTVLTENINSHIDFSAREGLFKSNEDYTLVSFPENKYVSFLNTFAWNMNQKILAMGSGSIAPARNASDSTEGELVGPRYICTDPDQDSLSFIAPLAFYDYDSNLIKATEVKYIDIADARIFPHDEKLIVQPDARLRTLYKANVLANRNTRYFDFFNATLNIGGRNKYIGSAFYNYVDELKQEQTIYVNQLGVDNNFQTIGSGEISKTDEFTLSPNYKYQGKFYLQASDKFLTFDGSTLIEHNCDNLPTRWMHFRSEVDPLDIYLPVGEDLIDIDRNKIFNGPYIYYDSVHIYPTFLSGRKFSSDKPLVTATGYLHYDKESQQYRIASKEKLLNLNSPGNLLSLHRENCELYGEGVVDLGAKLGQVKLTSVGNVVYKMATHETGMDVLLGIDFYIPDNIINVMAAEIDSAPGLRATDLNRPLYTKGIIDLIGKTRYDEMKSELSLFGTLKAMPQELKHTIMFNELQLKWDDESNSWVSVGKIGIASINNTPVNKRVDGLLELQIKRSGDVMDFYLQIDRNTWYYFGYTRGVMQILSSNQDFLEKMMKLKPNERRQKAVGAMESYIYMVSTEAKKNTFLRRYREVKNKQEEPAQEQ